MKLTEAVTQAIVADIRRGAFPHVAATAAGVAPSTFYLWMNRASRARAPRRLLEFSERVRQAAAEARVEAEAEVFKGDKLSWLRLGPGRDRPGEAGWTESSTVTLRQPESIRVEIVYTNRPPVLASRTPTVDDVKRAVDGLTTPLDGSDDNGN